MIRLGEVHDVWLASFFFGGGKVVCRQLLAQTRDAKSTSEPHSIPSCHGFAHGFVPGHQKLHCSSPNYSLSVSHIVLLDYVWYSSCMPRENDLLYIEGSNKFTALYAFQHWQ